MSQGNSTERPYIEDLPEPTLVELQQRDIVHPVVPVNVQGPVQSTELPARMGVAFPQVLTTTMQSVVGRDLSRKRITLLCDAAWLIAHKTSAVGAPWPANVPLVLTHADAIYAAVPTGTGNLSVIPEQWAD